MKTKLLNTFALISTFALLVFAVGCKKIERAKIDEPAYLRVFNDLNYTQNMENKNGKYPSLCMIINPVLDASGMPTGGEIVGDFLDKRETYAPPYPSHAGNSSSVQNPEYPGKQSVLAGPVLNGFDLSSWAQVPSGRLRIMFFYRPYSSIPFFKLDESLKRDLLSDTTIDLTAKEVYTLHVLQKDFVTRENGVLLRQENFHKLPLSDSLAYVNFYNYSAKGFEETEFKLKPQSPKLTSFKYGIKEEMNIFLSLFNGQAKPDVAAVLPGYNGKYLGKVLRNTNNNAVATYYDFPLWAAADANGIKTDIWQRFQFLVPGLDIVNNLGARNSFGNYASMICLLDGQVELSRTSTLRSWFIVPNLLVSLHSDVNNPQTFATVSSIEIINSNVYLTTVQRKYAVPKYN